MSKKIITCKTCGAQIAKSAKTCPQCGAKNKRHTVLGIILLILGVIIIIGSIAGGGDDTTTPTSSPYSSAQNTSSPKPTATPITYTAYTVDEMREDLAKNALKAEEKYDGHYVEITGRLALIDSDGRYISLFAQNDPYAILGVQCYMEAEHKEKVMDMEIGDIITLQGKITDVGEVISFCLDIDHIVRIQPQ